VTSPTRPSRGRPTPTPRRSTRTTKPTGDSADAVESVDGVESTNGVHASPNDASTKGSSKNGSTNGSTGGAARPRTVRGRIGPDPDGGSGHVHDLLTAGVEEAARLLDADGAMVYLIDPASGHLRFAHDAGIRSRRSRAWVRSIDLPVGVGMFGQAVAERSVVLTRDYLADETFTHAEDTDRVVDDIGIRSMVVAPMVAGDEVFGALGTFSSKADAFSPAQIGLVRALADHAAAAMANARLIEALDSSRDELAKRADIERSLREIGARISAAADFQEVLQLSVDEAARLMDADGARIDLISDVTGLLQGAYDSGSLRPDPLIPPDPSETIDQGVAGQAVVTGRPYWTGDYLTDARFRHLKAIDTYIRSRRIRSVMAAPLSGGAGPFGALLVSSGRPDAWGEADAELLATIADQASIAIRTTRLIGELDASRDALARRAQAEQALREIAARITVLREPGEILRDVVKHAGRLVGADGVILDLLDPATGNLHWAMDDGRMPMITDNDRQTLWISVGVGVTGQAVAEDRVIVADDDLASLFPPSPESTDFYERTGFHSMIAAPITGESGPLGVIEVYSRERGFFTETDASLVGALASQAAIAITNARLIEELAASRTDLARTADAERTLREIAGRVSATHDQDEILQAVIDASVRLLGATGAMIDLLGDAGMADAWTSREAGIRAVSNISMLGDVSLAPDAGVSGRSVRTRQVEWTGSYLEDTRFRHTRQRDAFVRASGIKSVIAAPLIHRDVVVGAITVYGERPDAFGEGDAGLLSALADQAAVAIANARLIDELERSRTEIARRADAEQTLREIAATVSAILEPDEVLQRIVDETTRLLESDGARIDLYDPAIDALRWSYAAGETMAVVPKWARDGGLRPGQAVAGTAFQEQRAVRTDDYITDDRFAPDDGARAFVEDTGIRSVVAVPLPGEAGPIGTLSVVSRSIGAYDDADASVLTALSIQASIAIRNARLIEELARSRGVIERRAEAEQSLRQIAARITAIRRPGDLLQQIVDEARRLLRADGAVIDEYDPAEGVLVAAYDAGLTRMQRKAVRETRLRSGEGLSGQAMAEGRVIAAGDYLGGQFKHMAQTDELARTTGIGDLIVAPIIGDEGPLGAIEVYRHERHAFDEIDAAVLGGLADQAAIAITNARLIEELERSQMALAHRADTERALRDITARIAALREVDVILDRVVEEAKRLLKSDGAHLTRMSEDGTHLTPVVVDEATGKKTQFWLIGKHFPLDGGINGLAASGGQAVWTADYGVDPRIPHDPDDVAVAKRMGLVGMAAAPLRAPGGDIIGTLAISSAHVREFQPDELDLLQGLADQAAIAITNSTLLGKLTESEERYRYLVENAPDIVWSIGADTRLTFVSDAVERLTGFRSEELVGRHFGDLLHPSSQDVATFDWTAGMSAGSQDIRGRINLQTRDGSPIPAEFIATARLDDDGTFVGANGSVRDMRDRDRLERELRESEIRYRNLASSSPDLVFATDAEGRYTFLSDQAQATLGWDLETSLGRHFSEFVAPGAEEAAAASFLELIAAPTEVHTARIEFRGGDGRPVPLEINVIGSMEDGKLTAIHGVARDVSERERLERELHESEARYRQLVQATPDVIYRCDAEGRFIFMAEGAEALFGWKPSEAGGLTFADLTADESLSEALANFADQHQERDVVRRFRYMLKRRDGSTFPGDISSVAVWEDGRFAGVQGTVRDVGEQERLERELRESQERYRFLIENSPDVVFATDAQGRFTFMSDAMEKISGWKPEEVIGDHFSKVVDEDSHPEALSRWSMLMADPTVEQVAHINLRSPDGRLIPVEVSSIGMVDDGGSFVGIHGSTRDISERDRLERELRDSEERYRYLVASSPDLVWLTDADGIFTFISDAVRTMLGYEPTELMGRHYGDIFAPGARRDATVRFRWVARHPSAVHRMRLPFRHADGHDVMVEINGTGMMADGKFIGAHGAARDVSERDRLERDLRRQAGELAAGEERAHLARELHDSVTQALFSMTLVSRSVEMLLDRDPEAARVQLAQLRELQREALAEMRALIFELRPGNLEQDGLPRALKTHTAALQGRIGLPVAVESTLEDRLPLPVEEVLYRIAQEALHNVVKHANARQVRVELGRVSSGVRMKIIDDGRGFDPDSVPTGHLGLAGMQARATKIGARFACRSGPGTGTTIEVTVPTSSIKAAGAAPAIGERPSIRDE
jgi:PAS domain S-box-containing protein